MDDAMARSVKAGLGADMRREPIMDGGYSAGIPVARYPPIGKLSAVRIGDLHMRRRPDALHLTMSACRKGPVGHRLEYRELDAG